jgi:hypothetical protein
MGRRLFILAVGIELVGIGLVGSGIGYEMATGADLGYVLITGGSILVAAGGVIFGKFVKAIRR